MILEKKYFDLTGSLVFKIFLNIFVVFYVAKNVSVSAFGSFSIAFIFSAMAILFLDYGFNLRSLVLTSEDENDSRSELWHMVFSKAILAVFLVLVTIVLYYTLPYENNTIRLILILMFSSIPNSFGNYFVNAFKIKGNYRVEAKAYAIQFFTLLFLLLLIELCFNASITLYAVGILIARLCYFLYSTFVFIRGFPMEVKFDFNKSIKAIKSSGSYAIHMILSALIIYIDTLILSIISDVEQVGFYQAGMRIIMASMLISVILSDAFIPEISKLNHHRHKALSRLAKLFEFVILFGILTVATLFFYKKTVINLLFSNEYLVLENSILIILSIIFLRYLGIVPGIILTSFKQQKIRASAVVTSVLASVFLNILLIPKFGIIGAFTASLMAHIVLNIFYLYFGLRTLPFYRGFSVGLILTFGILIFLIQKLFMEDTLIFLIITIIINGFLIGIYAGKSKLKNMILNKKH